MARFLAQRKARTPAGSLCCSTLPLPGLELLLPTRAHDEARWQLSVALARPLSPSLALYPYLLPSLDTHSITTESSGCNIRCNENRTLPALELLEHPVSLALHARHTDTNASTPDAHRHTHTSTKKRTQARETHTDMDAQARLSASQCGALPCLEDCVKLSKVKRSNPPPPPLHTCMRAHTQRGSIARTHTGSMRRSRHAMLDQR